MKKFIVGLLLMVLVLLGACGSNNEEEGTSDTSTKYSKKEFLYGVDDHEKYRPNTEYEDIARNPDKFKDALIIMSGQIGQVIDADEEYQYLIVADGNPDHIIYAHLLKDNPKNSDLRLLEGDNIVVYALSNGLTKYETTEGSEREVPDIIIHQYTHP